MDFLQLAQTRYTTKKYDASGKLSDDKLEQLKEILRLSPSSIDSQPWQFAFVSDAAVKAELSKASFFNEHKVTDAACVVVFSSIDDIAAFEKQIQATLPETAVNYYMRMVKPQSEAAIKSWLQHQVYLSLGFFLAACASLGIDSTPMEGIDTAEYDRILHIEGYKTLFAVAIGRRSEEDANQPLLNPKSRLPLEKVVKTI